MKQITERVLIAGAFLALILIAKLDWYHLVIIGAYDLGKRYLDKK